MDFLKNKRVLVTGACGTVGKELVHQLLNDHQIGEFVGIDNNESELYFLEQRFQKHENSCWTAIQATPGRRLAAKSVSPCVDGGR